MLLLITATPREAAPLLAAMSDVRPAAPHGVATGNGTIAGTPVTLATTGVGRAATAFVLSRLLLDEPRLVVQVGVGGAFPQGLEVGAVAVATQDTYADLGVRTDAGWITAEELGFPLVTRDGVDHFDTFPCDPEASAAAASATGASLGPFVTVETVTGSATSATALADRHGALVESMEGAAAAHACLLTGTPFVQIRAASNLVGPRDRDAWRLEAAIDAAATATLTALPTLMETIP